MDHRFLLRAGIFDMAEKQLVFMGTQWELPAALGEAGADLEDV